MNFNHVGLLGCSQCYWMGRKSEDEDNTCPSCGYKDVFDATLSYDRTHHELHELGKYEVYLLYKEYREKRNANSAATS